MTIFRQKKNNKKMKGNKNVHALNKTMTCNFISHFTPHKVTQKITKKFFTYCWESHPVKYSTRVVVAKKGRVKWNKQKPSAFSISHSVFVLYNMTCNFIINFTQSHALKQKHYRREKAMLWRKKKSNEMPKIMPKHNKPVSVLNSHNRLYLQK